MPVGKRGTCRFQNYIAGHKSIEHLKNRLADNSLSFFDFYLNFFRKYKKMDYIEFLELINVYEIITPELKAAIDDFWELSK